MHYSTASSENPNRESWHLVSPVIILISFNKKLASPLDRTDTYCTRGFESKKAIIVFAITSISRWQSTTTHNCHIFKTMHFKIRVFVHTHTDTHTHNYCNPLLNKEGAQSILQTNCPTIVNSRSVVAGS